MKTNQLQKNIPNGWQIKPFNDCFDVASKLQGLKKSDYNEQGKYPIIDQAQSFITGYTDDNSLLQEKIPTIIFGDHTRILKYINFPYVLGNDGTKIIWPKKENDPKFLFYSLLKLDIPNTGYNRHFKYLEQARINVPLKSEQEKIAEILSKVDEDIEKSEKIIGETEKLKNGLILKLFSDHQNNKKFKLKDISEVTSSKRVMVSDYVNKGIPFYRSTEIIKKSKNIPVIDTYYISQDKFNFFKNNFGAPEFGDILITAVGTIGDVYLVKNETFYFKDGNTLWIRKIKNTIIPEYLKMILASSLYREKLNVVSGGSSQKALTIQKLENIEIPIPSIKEQENLTKILSGIDEKILVNKKLKEKLTKLKKGLMSDLLSGKVMTV